MSVASKANIDAWFERIGFAGSIAPSLETLSQLVQLHLTTIPFENLDPLMGAPVRLELANLQQKLLFDRRGGYCLEHNLLVKAMLEELDYEVKLHPAVVLWGREEPVGEPASHVILTVDIAGTRYLVVSCRAGRVDGAKLFDWNPATRTFVGVDVALPST